VGWGGPGEGGHQRLVSQPAANFELDQPTRTFKWKGRRRKNRRVNVQRRTPFVAVADGFSWAGRAVYRTVRTLGKVLLLLGLLALLLGGGRLALEQITGSPRFALQNVEISATSRITPDEIVELARVAEGDRLLKLDTDLIAARVAEHPWAAEVRVSRRLPSVLRFDVIERRAVATVNLGGLYLVDETGRPFKRATMSEADGLPVLTGLERSQYVDHRGPSEAVFREALAILSAYRAQPGRPEVGEVNMSPRYGFTLFLLEGGAEIRLGRRDYDRKLARLDQIFEAVKTSGADPASIRVVHLDGSDLRKVPVRLHVPSISTTPVQEGLANATERTSER
jgi:cell division septal protein FtsQ